MGHCLIQIQNQLVPTGDPSDVGNIGGPSSLVDGSSGAPSLDDVGGLITDVESAVGNCMEFSVLCFLGTWQFQYKKHILEKIMPPVPD